MALLLGGPFNGREVDLRREPHRIQIQDRIYEQITDPDTGEGLGAYVITERDETSPR